MNTGPATPLMGQMMTMPLLISSLIEHQPDGRGTDPPL